ncbi:MAG: outer membrane beta-barrel protein [Ignavibacteria bacterium]
MKNLKVLLTAAIVILLVSVANSQTPIKLNLTGGASLPVAAFSDMYKTGFSIEGGVFYSIPMVPVDLTLTAGYNQFTYKNEYFTDLVTTNLGVGVTGFNPSWNAVDIPLMIGAKYIIPAKGISPYIWGEIGVHFLSFNDRLTGRVIGNSSSPTEISLNGATESGKETTFGYAIGGGITIPIAPKIGIDINVKFNGNTGIYAKAYEVFRNSNSKFTNPEMKNMGFMTARAGILITL